MPAFHPLPPLVGMVGLAAMAIGTTGGKLGCVVGPILAIPALLFSAGWFQIELDSGPWYWVLAWLFLGLAVAIAGGLLVRFVINRMFDEGREF